MKRKRKEGKRETSLDFEKESVPVLFRRLFFPTVLGMLSMSAVTTIDGIFVGHGTGSDGIAAVNICIPLLMFFTGVGLMGGVGCSVVASVFLSRGKARLARANILQTLLFVSSVALLLWLFVALFPERVALFLGASPHLLSWVMDYLLWFTPSLLFEMWVAVALFAIRLDGAPQYAMWCSVVPAVLNVVLDWLFIFPFGWGVMGAAFATSISCFVGGVMVVYYMFFSARRLRLCLPRWGVRNLRFALRNLRTQCKIGSSAMLGEATMAVLFFVGNQVFMHYLGDDGVGAFGVSCYYLPFVFMIGNAIAQSAQPVISYNYGLDRRDRVRSAFHMSLLTTLVCGLLTTVTFVLFPELLVGLFLKSSATASRIAVAGFPYYGAGFLFFILNLCIIGYFQSVERVRPAAIFAVLRGCVFLIPCFLWLPKVMGVKGIWLAQPLAEILTLSVIVTVFSVRSYRKLLAESAKVERGEG